jgi:sulfotransferase
LLSTLLSQNFAIHAEGNSGLCQIMWDTLNSCRYAASEQLAANNRLRSVNDIVSQLPHIYYKRNSQQEKIVLDKCRTWTLPANVQMLDDYVGKETKVIVLVRPIVEIVRSFVKLYKENGEYTKSVERDLLKPNTDALMKPLAGVYAAQQSKSDRFLFVSYKDLVEDTTQTLKGIYDFCGWEQFIHNTNNIKQKYAENDDIYGLKGMHSVRKKVGYRKNHTQLMDETVQKCMELDKALNLIDTTVNTEANYGIFN